MFRDTLQVGAISVLYSQGSKPLQVWDEKSQNGHISVVKDEETKTSVIEIMGQNCSTNFISGPNTHKDGFAIKMPYLHILVKSLKRDFSFEVQALDHKRLKRRFKFSNWFKDTRVKSTVVCAQLRLTDGWNHCVFDFTKIMTKSYGTYLQEITSMNVNANCRLRRIFFTDKPYHVATEIPNDFKVFVTGECKPPYKEEIKEIEEENNEEANDS